jgi:hypothetical protein
MIPEEDKVEVKNWIQGKVDELVGVEAYLTEGEPLHGASGSPVFVRRSLFLGKGKYPDDLNAQSWAYGTVWLLGLMSDCYFERAKIQGILIPRGINIVVPSMKINEVLDHLNK